MTTSKNDFYRQAKAQRRVVITGMSMMTPLGLNMKDSWENALKGKSGIERVTAFDPAAYDSKIAGEVRGFDPTPWIPKKEQKKMDRFIHLAIATADMALQDAGLQFTEAQKEKSGVILGVGMGGLPAIEEQHQVLMERGPGRLTPFFIPMVITNMAPGHVSIRYGIKGPNYTLTSACASGAHAIGEAANYIRSGLCDIMISGGTEAVITPMAIGGFAAMKALSTRNDQPEMASRPFDRDRDGFVIAEGSASLILEDYEHAVKRGARIYGEVAGYGLSSDAYHMTSPLAEGTGAALAMRVALEDANLNPEQIGYVNAHGTSTPVGDLAETNAIKSIFKDHAKKLWVSSTKSMMGHSLGAAGAIETVFSTLALHTGAVPPTINLDNPSDGCDLDYVPHAARERALTAVMNNSFGFGGTNACLVVQKIK